MKNIFALTKRNCLLFLRSKSTVFFSFFSSIILVVLYFLFIAKLYAQGFNELVDGIMNSKQLNFAIYSQMIVGVLVINSVSLSVGMFTFMAIDFEKRKTDAFLLTKATKFQLIISYLLSALLVSFVLNLFMFILAVLIIGIATSYWLSAGAFFAVVGVLIILTVVSCSIMLLITTLVRSSTALGVINGIIGTILGFLCGIYMPYSNMGNGAKYVGSFLPFTHFAIWLKQIVLNNVFYQLNLPDEFVSVVREQCFSAENIGFCGLNAPLWVMILIGSIFALICIGISIFLINTKGFSGQPKHINDKKKKDLLKKSK